MTTLLKGGTIITGAGQRRADLLLDGEKIAWMGRGSQTADQVVDVTGQPSGAAPPRSLTSPAPTRASPCTTDWTCGIRRQTAGPSATTAST